MPLAIVDFDFACAASLADAIVKRLSDLIADCELMLSERLKTDANNQILLEQLAHNRHDRI